eukprot:2760332-Ditylum_brightwellii.AAC.1
MVDFVTSVIDRFNDKQDGRMMKKGAQSVEEERKYDMQMDKFCLAMDNYFTLPDVISSLRKKDIGVVGTARMRKGWPPAALQKPMSTTSTSMTL